MFSLKSIFTLIVTVFLTLTNGTITSMFHKTVTLKLQQCPASAIVFKEEWTKDEDGSFEKQAREDANKAFALAKDSGESLSSLSDTFTGLRDAYSFDFYEYEYQHNDLPEGLKDLWNHPVKGVIKREIKMSIRQRYDVTAVEMKAIAIVQVTRPPSKSNPTIALRILEFYLSPNGAKEIEGLNASHLKSIEFIYGFDYGEPNLRSDFNFDQEGSAILKKATQRNLNKYMPIFINNDFFAIRKFWMF